MIYMDYGATTPVSDSVLEVMLPYFKTYFGNPSSVYELGKKSRERIEASRLSIATSLGCQASEIYFTSGGTESDNWALKSSLINSKNNHIITTSVEHSAILATCRELESTDQGVVTYLPVNDRAEIDVDQLVDSITDKTRLVSVMFANNEVGTLYPIEEIGTYCRQHNILFHVDAVQALGKIPIHLKDLPVDMMSFSGHKIYGPKGMGILYMADPLKLPSLIVGGDQEQGRRGGTENVPGIVGLGKAVEEAVANVETNREKILSLRENLLAGLLSLPGVHLNGPLSEGLPGHINLSIEGIKSQVLLPYLDMHGLCLSQGSACSAGSIEPSHVLYAMGRRGDLLRNSLRITISEQNTLQEIEEVIALLEKGIKKFRK